MKRVYRLEGLDCANCAAKLEHKLSKIDGMKDVSVDFMTLRCTMNIDDHNADATIEAAIEMIKKEEPDVEIRRI